MTDPQIDLLLSHLCMDERDSLRFRMAASAQARGVGARAEAVQAQARGLPGGSVLSSHSHGRHGTVDSVTYERYADFVELLLAHLISGS